MSLPEPQPSGVGSVQTWPWGGSRLGHTHMHTHQSCTPVSRRVGLALSSEQFLLHHGLSEAMAPFHSRAHSRWSTWDVRGCSLFKPQQALDVSDAQ